MKNLIILLILAFAIPSFGQSKAVNKFYRQYKHTENTVNFNIQGWVLKMVATFVDDDEDFPKDIIRKISHLRVLVMDNGSPVTSRDFNNLLSDVKDDDFETLVTVRSGGDNVHFMIREHRDLITDAVLLVKSQEEFVLISIEGAFSLNDLKNLDLDIDGIEHFDNIKGEL